MTRNIPRTPIEEAPYGVIPSDDLVDGSRAMVAAALAEAGVDLGAYDERIVNWLGAFDAVTAVTISSWIVRAHAAGGESR